MSTIHGPEEESHLPANNSYEKGNRNLKHFKGSADNDTFDISIRESPIRKRFDNDDATLILEKSSFMQESPRLQRKRSPSE